MPNESGLSERPQFSVITVTRNDLGGLKSTLKSVAAQTCEDFEWVVVDGDSSDGTRSFLQTLYWPNLNWISEPDGGIYDAMNKGAALSRGQFFIFMNAGDQFADDAVLARVTRALRAHGNHDVIYGDAFQLSESGALFLKPARSAKMITYGMFTHHQSMFFARDLFVESGYDTTWKIAGDYALVSTAYKNKRKFLRVYFAICIFAEGGVSNTQQALGRREVALVQRHVLKISATRQGLNRLIQWGSSKMRVHLKPLYNFLRFRMISRKAA